MHHYNILGESNITSAEVGIEDYCDGQRCSRGRCVPFGSMCDGVKDCEDGNDESETVCEKKHNICSKDPYQKGCGNYIHSLTIKNIVPTSFGKISRS